MNTFRTLLGAPGRERIKHIHFVGIGGSGMNGIAEVLLNEGYKISGSDQKENDAVRHLREQGAEVFIGHAAENIKGAHVVVKSTAISYDNIEIRHARDSRIPVVRRAEMLAELMRSRYGIAIAGTHGKTTTTSLVTSVLALGKLDPTFVIGGKLNSAGTNAVLGSSRYMVTEADESDASFLHLLPMMTVVTNIDEDHMDTYGGDIGKLDQTFIDFLHHLPFYGLAILCLDDVGVKRIIPKLSRPILTYGLTAEADIYATDIVQKCVKTEFTVHRKQVDLTFRVTLNLPGEHNVQNALAAIAVALELGIKEDVISAALNQFAGVGRRMQLLGEYDFGKGQALLIDDYGHHPCELAATIKAVRASWPDRRLVLAFQPHRYTRTRDLFDSFVKALSVVDDLLLLNIYSAGENPINGITSERLGAAIATNSQLEPKLVKDRYTLPEILPKVLQDGDVVLLAGAGDIGACSAYLSDVIQKHEKERIES